MPGAVEIKGNRKRTVRLEPGPPAPPERVVKRFHAPGHLDRLRDGWRARGERRALETARARGLPVPRSLGVTRRADRAGDRRWELATEWVPGAVSVIDILEGRRPWPVRRAVALRSLGALLATMARAGLRHPDLHPGNALLDDGGNAWLVDLHGAHFERSAQSPRPSAQGSWTGDLLTLCAATRELLSPGERALCLDSFRRELSENGCAASRGEADLAREIEDRARSRRRQRVARRARVWFRDGSPTVVLREGGRTGVRRRDLDPAAARAWILGEGLPCDGANHTFLEETWTSAAGTREAWAAAARLEEHRIPAARPACLDLPHARILFHIPRGCTPSGADDQSMAAGELARSLGQLLGTIHDRGFSAPIDRQSILVAPSGPEGARILLAPGFALAEFRAEDRWREIRSAGAALGPDTVASRDFRAAYLAALRHSGGERARLLRGWDRG